MTFIHLPVAHSHMTFVDKDFHLPQAGNFSLAIKAPFSFPYQSPCILIVHKHPFQKFFLDRKYAQEMDREMKDHF